MLRTVTTGADMARTAWTALAALLLAAPAAGQAAGRHPLLPESRVWVEGTSNKNDWTVEAKELSGFVVLRADGGAVEVSEGGFRVASRSMASEHGVIMDRLMRNALRSEEHPEIVYELVGAEAAGADGGRTTLTTTGRLTLAGVTKEIAQTVTAERLGDGRIRFTGSHPVDMVEYGITPPTAMFGSLRTARRTTVHFELLVKP